MAHVPNSSRNFPFGERAVSFALLVGALAAATAILGSGCAGSDGAQASNGDVPVVIVNEFMASNTATLQDASAAYPDWIELYNAEADTVDLSGFWLTDDLSDPLKWQIPDGVTIDGGGYLVIFADGDVEQGDHHASFKLHAPGGEDIALFGRNVDDNPLIDKVEAYEAQASDLSAARQPDGSATWNIDDSPTPGETNR